MARKFLTPIDLNKLELQNARIQNLASDPASPVAGQIYYNTADSELKYYNGGASAWQVIGQSVEQLQDAVADLIDAGFGISVDYDDNGSSLTITNTGVLSLTGTEDEITVSASAGNVTLSLPSSINADTTGNAATATALETARTISFAGALSGSASFDGTSDITITALIDAEDAVSSINGTENEINVSASVGAVTLSLPDTIYVDVQGTAASATYATTAGTANSVAADSVALGTDTTGDYVAGATAGTGISIDGSGGEGSSLTISNTGVISLSGTANEVTVSASAGAVTIGLPDDVTIGGSLIVTGDLTVSGSTTYLNTATLQVEDNKVVLNSNATGSPTVDAGIEVERGDAPNAELFWDESAGKWTSSDGSASYALSLEGHTHSASAITDFTTATQAAIDEYLINSDTISVETISGMEGAFTRFDVIVAGSASYLSAGASGLEVNKVSLEAALVTDGFTRKASANVGNGSATTFAITHNLNSRDAVVNVYDNSTYETVEVDVVRTDANNVTVTFGIVPTSNAYRVVIVA
jgi:hypothetical protein